jgi:nondiscriminating glutamyl-tRNA synthetase
MQTEENFEKAAERVNPFGATDVLAILKERGWLAGEPTVQQTAWSERAAALLGVHVANREALEALLTLIFRYDAREILAAVESHVVLSRYAAREVLRNLASLVLEGGPLSVDRFREIIDALKAKLDLRGRELFHPIRLALAGRAGEGELDRVVLLLEDAAEASFASPVKRARVRILEFCSALD